MVNVWKNGLAILGSVLITLLVAELALRWLWPAAPRSVLMMSSPAMVMAARGVVTYAADTPLRVVTADELGIIYDVKLRTNNLGALDDTPYSLSEPGYKIALVGDSFTAGYHGGQPWVPVLRNGIPADWRLFGLGVDGTGVQHFETLLRHFDPDAALDRVLLLAIGNDFYRDHWYLSAGESGVWFCRHVDTPARCADGRPPIIHYLPYEATEAQVLAAARAAREAGKPAERRLMITSLVGQAFSSMLAPNSKERLSDAGVVANLDALDRIAERYGRDRVTLIHLPTLAEIVKGDYDLDLAGFTKGHRIDYFAALTACPFNADMFYAREPHPNAKGYEHITRCVERFLQASLTSKTN